MKSIQVYYSEQYRGLGEECSKMSLRLAVLWSLAAASRPAAASQPKVVVTRSYNNAFNVISPLGYSKGGSVRFLASVDEEYQCQDLCLAHNPRCNYFVYFPRTRRRTAQSAWTTTRRRWPKPPSKGWRSLGAATSAGIVGLMTRWPPVAPPAAPVWFEGVVRGSATQ